MGSLKSKTLNDETIIKYTNIVFLSWFDYIFCCIILHIINLS